MKGRHTDPRTALLYGQCTSPSTPMHGFLSPYQTRATLLPSFTLYLGLHSFPLSRRGYRRTKGFQREYTTMGKGRLQLKRIQSPTRRQVTFSKRRNGLLKKACELSVLCDAEVAVIVISPTGRTYEFASHGMSATLEKYQKFSATNEICSTSTKRTKLLTVESVMGQLNSESHDAVRKRQSSAHMIEKVFFETAGNVQSSESSAVSTLDKP